MNKMTKIILLHPTDHPPVDTILQSVVGSFEAAFPDRVRGYYLVGSYVDNKAVEISDIDLGIIFKGWFLDEQERDRANRLREQLASSSSIRLDLATLAEDDLKLEDVRLKLASVLIYGEDIRDRLSLPSLDPYRRWITVWPITFFRRSRDLEQLVYPLDYPDPTDEVYGYTRTRIPSWYPPGVRESTKELVASVCWTASATIALVTGTFVGTKGESIRVYRDDIGDEWASFLEDFYAVCYRQWHYQVPDVPSNRRLLRQLCGRTLTFENHYLTCYRDYLRNLSASASDDDQRFALRRLTEVVYPDSDGTEENRRG